MARSTTLTKGIAPQQIEFLHFLEDEEISIFTLEQIKSVYLEKTGQINEIIENLVDKKFLLRIERGKYCRSNFRDENVIGTFIASNSAIAYWSALNLHGLTEQFPNTIFVQTTQKKACKTIFGTAYQFVTIRADKRGGITYNGYGSYRYPITDIEKTIIDCFDLPQYNGGTPELIRAFAQADLSAEKMIDYCKMVNSVAVTKRIGFLAEFMQKKGLQPFIDYAQSCIQPAVYNLFDSNGGASGETNSRWRLYMNISSDDLTGIIEKIY